MVGMGSIEVYFTYPHISCLAVFGLTSDTLDLEVSDLHILRERTWQVPRSLPLARTRTTSAAPSAAASAATPAAFAAWRAARRCLHQTCSAMKYSLTPDRGMSQEDITIHHKTPSTEFILVLHRNFFVHVLCQSLQGYTSVFCKFHQTSTIKIIHKSTQIIQKSTKKPTKNQPKTQQKKSSKSSNSELPRLFLQLSNHQLLDLDLASLGLCLRTPPTETTSSCAKRRVQRFLGPLLRLSSALKKKRVQWGVMNDAWSKLMVPRIVHWYSEIHITIRFLKNETFSRLLPK